MGQGGHRARPGSMRLAGADGREEKGGRECPKMGNSKFHAPERDYHIERVVPNRTQGANPAPEVQAKIRSAKERGVCANVR